MSKNQEYAAKYAEFAMEQMRKYGIPASVTLAQGIVESSNGQSELSRLGNNHFGIKATPSWLKEGGDYLLYTDDRPNEKFCQYASVKDSYEHHSRFLKENSRYAPCFQLAADDYKGWTQGIARVGYATNGNYAANLQHIIEFNGLQKYDQMVMQEMKMQDKKPGMDNPAQEKTEKSVGDYSFPLNRKEFLFVTSPFGMRNDPMDKGKQQFHKGMDIKTHQEPVLATEKNGKVIAINQNSQTAGGKTLTVEYNQEDGSKMQCTYMHLSEISVKQGDTVQAGQRLGTTGNTGTRTTGEHLHFSVKAIANDGTRRDMDPAAYLADIARKGNIQVTALYNGNDLLAKYKADTPDANVKIAPEDWMKKLLSSEDSGVKMSGSTDPVIDMMVTAFTSLMMLAVQIDNKQEEQQRAAISEGLCNKVINLLPLLPHLKQCDLHMAENGKAVLQADNGHVQINRELTSAELTRLANTLNNAELSDESKQMRISGLVNTIILSQQASQNFEQGMSEQQGRQEIVKR